MSVKNDIKRLSIFLPQREKGSLRVSNFDEF